MSRQLLPREILIRSPRLIRKNSASEEQFQAAIVSENKGPPVNNSRNRDNRNELRTSKDADNDLIGLVPPAKRRAEAYPTLLDQYQEERREKYGDGYGHLLGVKRFWALNYENFENGLFSTRLGSNNSVHRLEKSFRNLDFETKFYENLTYDETMAAIGKLQKLCNEGGTKMIALAFMSHGDGKDPDSFVTNDGKSVSMNRIRSMFSNSNCPGLSGHPKIFFGFYCRNIKKPSNTSSQPSMISEVDNMRQHVRTNVPADPDVQQAIQLLATENLQVVGSGMETTSSGFVVHSDAQSLAEFGDDLLGDDDQWDTDPFNADQLGDDQWDADPFKADQLGDDQWDADQLNADQLDDDQSKANQFHADQLDADQLDDDQWEANQFHADQLGADHFGDDQWNDDQWDTDQLDTDQFGNEPRDADHLDPDPLGTDQCDDDQFGTDQLVTDGLGDDQSIPPLHMDGAPRPRSRSILEPEDLEDMTTIHSSRPGMASYRHPRTGSVAEICLSEVLDEFARTFHSLDELYYHLQRKMKARQTGASSEYSFSPDKDDLMMKRCYLY